MPNWQVSLGIMATHFLMELEMVIILPAKSGLHKRDTRLNH